MASKATHIVALRLEDLERDTEKHTYQSLLSEMTEADALGNKNLRFHRFTMLLSMLEEDTRRKPEVFRAYEKMEYFFELIWKDHNEEDPTVAFVYKGMGLMHLNFKNKPRALHFLKTSFRLCKSYINRFKTMDDILEETFKTVVVQYPMTLFEEGEEKVAEDELEEMYQIFHSHSELSKKDSNYGALLSVKGGLSLKSKRYEDALKWSRKALKLVRGDTDINEYESTTLKNIGFIHDAMENYPMAILTYDKVQGIFQDNFNCLRFAGRSEKQWLQVQYAKALCMMKSQQTDKQVLECFKDFQNIYRKKCEHREIVNDEDLKSLSHKAKNHVKTLTQKVEAASKIEKKRLGKKKKYATDEMAEAVIKQYKKDESEENKRFCIKQIDEMIEMKHDQFSFVKYKVYFLKGQCFKDLELYGDAMESFQNSIDAYKTTKLKNPQYKIIRDEKPYKRLLRILGETCMFIGYFDDAIEIYEQSLRMPGLPESTVDSKTNLAFSLIQKGNYDRAYQILLEAKAIQNKTTSVGSWKLLALPIRVRDYIGLTYYKKRSYQEAMKAFHSVEMEVIAVEGNYHNAVTLANHYFYYGNCQRRNDHRIGSLHSFELATDTTGRPSVDAALPKIHDQIVLARCIINYEMENENSFIEDIVELFFKETDQINFVPLGIALRKLNVNDQIIFFNAMDEVIFEQEIDDMEIEDDDNIDKLKIIKENENGIKRFQNSVRINHLLLTHLKAIATL